MPPSNKHKVDKSIISIIMPCFNAAKYIKKSIDSILAQSYENYEIIIQDSLSTDDTIEILKSYNDKRIKIYSEKDTDMHDGLWQGLNHSNGEYIMVMPASDEYLYKDWFKECIEILDNNFLIGLVHGNDIKKYDNGDYGALRFPEFENKTMPSGTEFLPYWTATKYHISELNYCVRRNIYFDCYKPYEFVEYDLKYIKDKKVSLQILESWNPLIMLTYNFIKKGYLPMHIPRTATATLQHRDSNGHKRGNEINVAVRNSYLGLIDKFENDILSGGVKYVYRNGKGEKIINKKFSLFNYRLNVLRHSIIRKDFDFDYLPFFNLTYFKKYFAPIFNPKRHLMRLSLFKYIRYIKHFIKFNKYNDGRFNISLRNTQIEINDWSSTHDFDHHYVYHTAWASRILYTEKPEKHIDISSDIRFSSLVSTFVNTEYYDIRKLKLELSGLITGVADLVNLPFQSESISSLSCMHVVEHCGLGRYGDVLDPKADLKAINELIRVLKPEGKLYFVIPVASEPRINFNAHRVYSHKQVMDYFSELKLIEFSLIPDDYRDGILIKNPSNIILNKQKYGCGCYLFTK